MTDVNNLLNKYKNRKNLGDVDKSKALTVEELTESVYRITQILNRIEKALPVTLLDLEMTVAAGHKVLVDKELLTMAELNHNKKFLQSEFVKAAEHDFDAANNLVTVDKPVEKGVGILFGMKTIMPATEEQSEFEIQGLCFEKFYVESYGTDKLIPLIESQLLGMKAGETKEFEGSIPEFGESVLKFKVFIHSVKEKAFVEKVEGQPVS